MLASDASGRTLAAGGEKRLEQENRRQVHGRELRHERESQAQRGEDERAGVRPLPRSVPGEHRREKHERRAEVGVDDAGVGQQIGIEGEQRGREERRHRAVPRASPRGRRGRAERPGQRGTERARVDQAVGRHPVPVEEVRAVVEEEVAERNFLRRRRQRQGRQREAREDLHEGRVLDVHDRRALGNGEVARQDVDRLVGREGVLARVVAHQKTAAAARARRGEEPPAADFNASGPRRTNAAGAPRSPRSRPSSGSSCPPPAIGRSRTPAPRRCGTRPGPPWP